VSRSSRSKRPAGDTARGVWRVLLPVLGLLAACAPDDRPLTQLVLVADTDIADIDTIRFEVSESGNPETELAEATRSEGSGPSYVAVVRQEGSLGPVTVTARGFRRGMPRIERVHRVSFVSEQTRVVSLHLLARCLEPSRCPAEQSCGETGCIGRDLTAPQLTSWSGTPPALAHGSSDAALPAPDARVSDAGSDAGSTELRQCGDAGLVDLQSDPLHCGECVTKCTGMRTVCSAGKCVKP